MSRFGIVVTEEEVRNTIMQGLGGGNSDSECIDLMEVVAILMIPTILKASQDANSRKQGPALHEKLIKPIPDLLQTVLTMILEDVSRFSFRLGIYVYGRISPDETLFSLSTSGHWRFRAQKTGHRFAEKNLQCIWRVRFRRGRCPSSRNDRGRSIWRRRRWRWRRRCFGSCIVCFGTLIRYQGV
jgi:hypothetical protein